MLSLEWLSSFSAIYRAGSVSEAARERQVSQSALSQQLAALEKAIGVPLFERTVRGIRPTQRGAALYQEVFEAIDCLERVSRSIFVPVVRRVLRFGSSPEYFHWAALPRLGASGIHISVTLGSDRTLLDGLKTGALDVALVTTKPTTNSIQFRTLSEEPYVLIGSSETPLLPSEITLGELATWLNAQPWVSYSEERPITRRFWQHTLGSRFSAKSALVAPDLHAVVAAVELGIGLSIVPHYLASGSLSSGRVKEIWPVADQIPPERRYACYRRIEGESPHIITSIRALTQAQYCPGQMPVEGNGQLFYT